MENFFKLRAEKQEHIINAALHNFGKNGYKKASIAEIAEEAGISKSMVLYYFGSKKNLYLYLGELCRDLVVEEIGKHIDNGITDFFDKIKMATNLKVAMMKKHLSILSFLVSMYHETDKEVLGEIEKFKESGAGFRNRMVLEDADIAKFKDDVEPELLMKFLVWAGEGIAKDFEVSDINRIDSVKDEFFACLDLMKKYFYK